MPKEYVFSTSPKLLRNDGVGDYYEREEGPWNILAVEMKDPRHTDLIHLHEFVEVLLIRQAGIPEPVIDAFDAYFEIKRKHGLVSENAEPGNDPTSPYYEQHQLATKIERIMCEEGYKISWEEYEKACNEFK